MTFYINSPNLSNMAFIVEFHVLMILLTYIQEAQVTALPTGNATRFFATSIHTKTLIQSWKNTTITQYPPTTTVKNTIPGTIGVSGSSFCHSKNREILVPL